MTMNQINYWKALNEARNVSENIRHNIATEQYTGRHYAMQDTENIRHNKVTERQTMVGLNETNRHNVATETIGRISANAASTNAAASYMNAQTNKWSTEIVAPTTARSNMASALQSMSQKGLNEVKTETEWPRFYGEIAGTAIKNITGLAATLVPLL